ncbi:acetoin dehydrogenase dihydrolipoyllysine-residue acetyltransferase subunit [Mesorhizobium sp. M2A.F.Ca.ET.043.05.1.1]|uniref:acetoin dehydrogenase dihydrolipoyllysine-residue acetyltransferase subunit n=1 Tax=Mesorhizobium sp. M2A.F.Ca.ET.043.05.1.1 TaxID=2493671 RepID=UPI000F75E88E|nr:acetoin dehydrogenase dihydrolipoyllysine-residue acetyltransferase subunit [Mesorhizobium sp. M2A.F.Ca.ET.043.05.1.1]AZO16123.1 acetoin dehydrogenase dihydrolipoyllysine-residue acetyltransferase subunit [Mesorhizobium sp. M2A.F.Ca.ET.043.05.1.1]
MATAVIFPKVSLETDAGTISRWLKEDGATVNQGEPLFEIDNAKAAVEVEAPASGIVSYVRSAGEDVQVGEVVAHILQSGERPEGAGKPAAKALPIAAATNGKSEPAQHSASARIVATPLAKRIAEQQQIDLRNVRGSGPRGRIQKRDLIDVPPIPRPSPAASQSPLNAVWLQKDGPGTLVALHGFASDHNAWRGLLAAGRPRARMLAVDLPGHGRSSRAVPTDLDAICAMVEQRMAAEGIDEAAFVAHSFGAAVASKLASRGFVRVNALLLISPAGLGPEIRGQFIKGFVAARQPSSILPWLHELVFDPGLISEAFVRSVVDQRKDEELSGALANLAERYFCDGTQTFSIRPDLERLRIPIRIIFGMQDRIIPFTHCHSLPGRVGLHAFQQCGHMPYLEEPELTLSIVNEMLALARSEP